MSEQNKHREFWVDAEGMDIYFTDRNAELACPEYRTEFVQVIEYSAYQAESEKNEVLRMKLAACGVAAMQNTENSKKDRITTDNTYYSSSYRDVCRAVDAEIELREKVRKLTEIITDVLCSMKGYENYPDAIALSIRVEKKFREIEEA